MLIVVCFCIGLSNAVLNVPGKCFGHAVKHVLPFSLRPPLPRVFDTRCISGETLLAQTVPPTRCKFGHMELSKIKTCMLRNLPPLLYKLLPTFNRGDTKSSSSDS